MAQDKIRKGQFCVIGERSSSTAVHGATTSNWTYSVGQVRKADKAGTRIVEGTVFRYGTELRCRDDMAPRFWQSWSLSEKYQAAAAMLVGRTFDNLEYLRDALRHAVVLEEAA